MSGLKPETAGAVLADMYSVLSWVARSAGPEDRRHIAFHLQIVHPSSLRVFIYRDNTKELMRRGARRCG
jgi:hypothetical protein